MFAIVVVWCLQAITVHFNYGGNWTGLFCIRDTMPLPAFLRSENLWFFKGSDGYDGQVFHLIAHDPWMKRGTFQSFPDASFRYQRIFVPALAWLLAFGQDRWIHTAYYTEILAFVFLGVYWTARFAERVGIAPAWGLAFVLTPAAIVSIDRMVADIALAAFIAGFAFFWHTKAIWPILTIFVFAGLTRETALPIIAAYALYQLTERRFGLAILAAITALPTILWYAYLFDPKLQVAVGFVNRVPFAGFAERIVHPFPYTLTPAKTLACEAADLVALAGIALAMIFVLRMALRKEWNALAAAVYASTLAIVFLKSRSVWEDAYAFGRVLTPFLFLTMLHELARRPWPAFLPIALILPRLSFNLSGQLLGILHGLLK